MIKNFILLFFLIFSEIFCENTFQVSFQGGPAHFTIQILDDNERAISGFELESSKFFFRNWGTEYNQNNTKALSVYKSEGTDGFGKYFAHHWIMGISDSSNQIDLSVKTYEKSPDLLVFEQEWIKGGFQLSLGNPNALISSFPSFSLPSSSSLLFTTWKEIFGSPEIAKWNSTLSGHGGHSGPYVIFDKNLNNIVISPLNNFLVSALTTDSNHKEQLGYGFLGEVSEIPYNWKASLMMVVGKGYNKNMEKWGFYMRNYYQKFPEKDRKIPDHKLGYWTDNGAYYYYLTAPGKNYEETIVIINDWNNNHSIPVNYFQLDSWWYYKQECNSTFSPPRCDGLMLWEPRPDIFPSGMENLKKKIGNKPFQLHNRWFSSWNDYLQYFPFVRNESTGFSLPIESDLFRFIMGKAKPWGLITYEQDWLITTYDNLIDVRNNVHFGRDWLKNMGLAAQSLDMSIQYCMPLPSFLLQSLEIETVVQARVSNDYQPGNAQWRIGQTSILHDALGISPCKDNFWSTDNPMENCKYSQCFEPNPELQALTSTLSSGPWGFSDQIGKTNVTRIMKTTNQDGTILKPDLPVKQMDLTFAAQFSTQEPDFVDLWSTWSKIGNKKENNYFYYIVGANLKNEWKITPSDLSLFESNDYGAFNYYSKEILKFSHLNPLVIPKASQYFELPFWGPQTKDVIDFSYFTIFPLNPKGISLIGEISKFTVASSQRFSNFEINESNGDLSANLFGSPKENVQLGFSSDNTLMNFECILNSQGRAKLFCSSKKCDCS